MHFNYIGSRSVVMQDHDAPMQSDASTSAMSFSCIVIVFHDKDDDTIQQYET